MFGVPMASTKWPTRSTALVRPAPFGLSGKTLSQSIRSQRLFATRKPRCHFLGWIKFIPVSFTKPNPAAHEISDRHGHCRAYFRPLKI